MTEPQTCDTLVYNGVLVTMDGSDRVLHRGAVAVRGCRIVAVGEERAILGGFRSQTKIDAGGGLIHPGFIDAHCHVNVQTSRGVVTDRPHGGGASFDDWYLAVRDEDEIASTRQIGLELLRNGYTCFAEPGSAFSPDTVAAAAESIGVRVVLADLLLWDLLPAGEKPVGRMQRAPVDHKRCMDMLGTELKRNRVPDAMSHGYVALNNIGNASDELLRAALDTARAAGSVLELHHNRTLELVARDDKRFGTPNLRHLYDRGFLDACCSFMHMNVIRDEEIEPIVRSGMSILWCPANSMYYGVSSKAPCRIPELLSRGVTVATGVDFAKAWTFSDMELIGYLLARAQGDFVSPVQLIEMRTRSAAKALGLSKEIGSLEPGKRADIVVRSFEVPEAMPGTNLAQDMVLSARSKNVDTVLVNGRIVYRGGQPTQVEAAKVFADVRASVAGLLERSGFSPDRYWEEA